MTDHAPFIATIRDAGENLYPRLVYADWLEEQGETRRAEIIRDWCALYQWYSKPVAARPAEQISSIAAIIRRHQKTVKERLSELIPTTPNSIPVWQHSVGHLQHHAYCQRPYFYETFTRSRFGVAATIVHSLLAFLTASNQSFITNAWFLWRAGLVEAVYCSLKYWRSVGPHLVQSHPIRDVYLKCHSKCAAPSIPFVTMHFNTKQLTDIEFARPNQWMVFVASNSGSTSMYDVTILRPRPTDKPCVKEGRRELEQLLLRKAEHG